MARRPELAELARDAVGCLELFPPGRIGYLLRADSAFEAAASGPDSLIAEWGLHLQVRQGYYGWSAQAAEFRWLAPPDARLSWTCANPV